METTLAVKYLARGVDHDAEWRILASPQRATHPTSLAPDIGSGSRHRVGRKAGHRWLTAVLGLFVTHRWKLLFRKPTCCHYICSDIRASVGSAAFRTVWLVTQADGGIPQFPDLGKVGQITDLPRPLRAARTCFLRYRLRVQLFYLLTDRKSIAFVFRTVLPFVTDHARPPVQADSQSVF
jgi:hypothetical protein